MTSKSEPVWRMTKDEHDKANPDPQADIRAGFGAAVHTLVNGWHHESEVCNALVTGKPVPMKVLKDYPDLLRWKQGRIKLYDHTTKPKQLVTLKQAQRKARQIAAAKH